MKYFKGKIEHDGMTIPLYISEFVISDLYTNQTDSKFLFMKFRDETLILPKSGIESIRINNEEISERDLSENVWIC